MTDSSFRYVLVDVFTERPFGGNPLAVFPDAHGVSERLMPIIARELNLSETVFVLPAAAREHVARLRIFTPGAELLFAGHPTVGTACVLAAEGRVAIAKDFVLQLGAGPVPSRVDRAGPIYHGRFDVPRLPERGPQAPTSEHLAAALSLDPSDLEVGDWTPEVWSCGVPFLVVPVRNREALGRARLDPAAWERWIAECGAPHLYMVTTDTELADSDVRARMFAPALGVPEDPATGSAASAFAGFLASREGAFDGVRAWRIEQGFEMGRPSRLAVEARGTAGAVDRVRVSGACVFMGEGQLHATTR